MTMPDADFDRDTRRPEPGDREPMSYHEEEGRSRRALMSPNDALQPERLPPPPAARKRRPGLLAAMSGFLTFLLVGLFVAGYALISVNRKVHEPGPLTADKVLYIAPGTDVPEIISQLENEGVINNPLLFSTALFVEGTRSKLRAGEYLFKQSASLQDVMDTMVSGRQILHTVTIPEGLTSEQIIGRLRENEFLTGDVREVPKEGTLLPETYKVSRSDARTSLLRKMVEDQRKLVEQVWSRRSPDLPVKTPFELVTLASIVERETGKADERPRVAAVFINRLNKRMRLQSDPTIVYGLVQGRGTLGRGILRSEVDKWTPYNTYQIEGLPPGPIANPGRAALEAVANPSRTAELFFVADGTGGHVFAETLDQHNRNVARWRQIEKEAREKGVADVDKAPVPNAPPTTNTPPTTRPERRGGLSSEPFGSLPTVAALGPADLDLTPQLRPTAPAPGRVGLRLLSEDSTPRSITSVMAERMRPKAPPVLPQVAAVPVGGENPYSILSYGPDVEALGIQVRGVQGRSPLLDGPAGDDPAVDLATIPVAASRRADQKAAAARLGLPEESDQLPTERPVAMLGSGPRRALDASEGSPLDPLRSKNWDLNHAQVVPALTFR